MSSLQGSILQIYNIDNDLVDEYNLPLGHVHCTSNHLLDNQDTFMIANCYVYLIWKWGSLRMWPVEKGCLLLLGISSHLWYIQGPC
jgi:hypothetical protein